MKEVLLDGRTNVYAVLDGVRVPDLPGRLHRSGVPNFCLLAGDLAPAMVHAAPYVVQLTNDNSFSDWIFNESVGKHWGIFAQSLSSMTEMRKHFRALVTVYGEDGQPMLFRFYDPRVLKRFLPTCNGGELMTLFGKVAALFAEGDGAAQLIKFEVDGGKLKQTELQ